jgi:hypothetical protein
MINARFLDLLLGVLLGLTGAMALVILTTDVDTPVATQPKCETIIIHK